MIDYDAEVERILRGPPGKVAFRALCAVLGRARSPQDHVALCDERLASWPDVMREAPWSWLAAFPRLRHLNLSRNHLGAAGARQLAADVRMPALEHLDLSGREGGSPYCRRPDVQPAGDPGAEAWASSHNAAKLTYLNMAATGLGVDGLVALMRSERLQQLSTLDLSHNPLGSWPAALENAPVWSTLRNWTCTTTSSGTTA